MLKTIRQQVHIVQIGWDDSVFHRDAASDTLRRQQGYAKLLKERAPGGHLTLLSFTSDPAAERFTIDNLTFIPIYARRRNRYLKLFFVLIKLHKERRISVIATQTLHIEAWVSLIWSLFRGVNIIGQTYYDVMDPYARRHEMGRNSFLIYALTRLFTRCLFAVRAGGRQAYKHIKAAKLNRNVHLIPISALTDILCEEGKSSVRKDDTNASAVDDKSKRVLFVGRLVSQKNIHTWLKVAQEILKVDYHIEFVIVGDGSSREQLEAFASNLGVAHKVRFLGNIPYKQLTPLYRSADVFLLTSLYEGLPRVALLSYLHEVPIVATKGAGVEDIVHNGKTGFIHSDCDIKGMAQSVLYLLHEDDIRHKFGKSGREIVQAQYNPDVIAMRWINLLLSAANRLD